MAARAIEEFVESLAATKAGQNSDNFFDFTNPGNAGRRRNLELYLQEMYRREPNVLLLGEAPGFRGMRITGVPFTNTSILQGGIDHFGLFGPGKGYILPTGLPAVPPEPTATVMWRVLVELDFLPLLWSAYPLHPHLPNNCLSNRSPTTTEALAGQPFWLALRRLFPITSVVAVGNVAYRSILASGRSAPKVRHPAHGGKARFRLELQELLEAGIAR
ncbi:uracil-DNA glycosylase [Arthrobacter rhizosphaerae]|uniref:uracil-DNA glycosylase n=1 Tax=Arthrobacter rhizosphaerae TaxID=2855490 RepID=UPI001FF44672|nr:uracil-DNA glycosylase [Arthrobacter rhizosphaerae]